MFHKFFKNANTDLGKRERKSDLDVGTSSVSSDPILL